jgi:hypothetical protein
MKTLLFLFAAREPETEKVFQTSGWVLYWRRRTAG